MNDKPWLNSYDPEVPARLEYPSAPLHFFLEESARKYPERVCTIYQEATLNYSQMERLTNRLAVGLAAIGLTQGARVGLFLPNLPQFVLAFYAVLKAGGVVTAVNPHFKQAEIEQEVWDAGVEFLIGSSTAQEALRAVRVRTIIWTDPQDGLELAGWANQARTQTTLGDQEFWLKDLILGTALDARVDIRVSADAPAIFQFSGGTTGTPKAAVGLHRNLTANTLQFRAWLHSLQEGQETILAVIPLYHVYGMVIAMSMGVALGARLVLLPDGRNTGEILRSIDAYRVTCFPGVPNMFQAIVNHAAGQPGRYQLGSIRACISGSAPLLRETKTEFERLTGGKLLEGYGLSEAPTATHCNPMNGENRSGSIGLPLPDVDCRIVSLADGETPVETGETGELLIRSPQVMDGYFNHPVETTETLRGGWLHTGDIAWMDAEGYFYLVDRKKSLIKIGGFQVWPREIEEVLAAHPKVKEAACAGAPDARGVEMVKAWVVLKPGEQIGEEELREWCGERLAGYKTPSVIEFRETLPRTSVGKVLRRELVRQHIETIHP